MGSCEDEPCLGQVSHALALHRGIVAVPSGKTKIDTRENPFTQVEGRSDVSDGESGIFCWCEVFLISSFLRVVAFLQAKLGEQLQTLFGGR